ncbi:DUF1203 domain-containing protein [Kribbella sp. CA-293567]|uniref:DUF1203 domain-containing protein n=1 Tax=Kribbella sp. CA-293567 TaxID=3002436 RepID=UPI0022DD5995|nr:DUF1203 domain-containing protein [Kribbella sp. CA-293567]WBQ06709.1 DUF1203 domain-containing protein [Kribbella sp. CA-293567]
MSIELEFVPVPASELDRIRCNGHDDFGNPLTARTSGAGAPLRCCLRLTREGEQIALVSHRPSALGGPYAEVGPVFVHLDPCPGPAESSFPTEFTDRHAVLRPYDGTGQMLDGVLVEPGRSESELTRLFDDPAVELVHVRNVIAGCWNFSVRRAPA